MKSSKVDLTDRDRIEGVLDDMFRPAPHESPAALGLPPVGAEVKDDRQSPRPRNKVCSSWGRQVGFMDECIC